MATRLLIWVLVLVSGLAAISWENIWQLETTLALGLSAHGTALTLATTMGGLTVGALAMGAYLARRQRVAPYRLYGLLELLIGAAGLSLLPALSLLSHLDTRLYAIWSAGSPAVHLLGLALVLGPPAVAMGATIPLFGLMARHSNTSISVLYGLNTAGAALGCVIIDLVLLPGLGVRHTILTVAGLNLIVGLVALCFPAQVELSAARDEEVGPPYGAALGVAFLTGFAMLSLEVAWFRSLRAAFRSTTDAFALMLAVVLISLALGAHLSTFLRRRGIKLEWVLFAAGLGIVLVTPIVERFDRLTPYGGDFTTLYLTRLRWCLLVLGPPIVLLGVSLPWLLAERHGARWWSRLYMFNTFGAILGSLSAAWIVMPLVGLARTAWIDGVLVGVAGLLLAPRKAIWLAPMMLLALGVAAHFESGAGRTRLMGWLSFAQSPYRILSFREGPDSTVAVAELESGSRVLVIDGFEAADDRAKMSHYMAWMGHLPMLMHRDPKTALVICFGTGQTANAVRMEGPERLDIVDVNEAVLASGHLFDSNQNVLEDARVHPHVMDGRAWLRRTEQRYDVITLEPMPPTHAGVNALYCEEFYRLARARLNPGGVVAQWLPFHLVPPYYSVSIVKTFQSVFPDSYLWIDPVDWTGILVGGDGLQPAFPGLERRPDGRNLTPDEVRDWLQIGPETLRDYARAGTVVTDDNQLLAHGALQLQSRYPDSQKANYDLVQWAWQLQLARDLEKKVKDERVTRLRETLERGTLYPRTELEAVLQSGLKEPEIERLRRSLTAP